VIHDGSPFILSIETATRAGSFAILKGARVLSRRAGNPDGSHSSDLLHYVREMLYETGLSLDQIDLFAVSAGPGSFTGLRIGLATVKSFAATLSRPCVGVQTLHAIAFAAGMSERTLALLPAGRGEVFAQMLAVNQKGDVIELEEPAHLAPQVLLKRVKKFPVLLLAGDGVQLMTDALLSDLLGGFTESDSLELTENENEVGLESRGKHSWLISQHSLPLAESIGALASSRFLKGEAVTPDLLRAIYVRPSDAELKGTC
jgi:tRNA threonylcarbamoyladenosine biosynthesis protein TsaB